MIQWQSPGHSIKSAKGKQSGVLLCHAHILFIEQAGEAKAALLRMGYQIPGKTKGACCLLPPGQADRLKRNDVCLATVNTQCYTEMNLGSLLFSAPGSVFRHGEQKVSLCSRGQTVCMCFAYDLRPEEVIAFDERI